MKASSDYILRQVADVNMLLPVGQAVLNFNGMIVLNESGSFLWRRMSQETTREALAEALMSEYNASCDIALQDVDDFLAVLRNANCLID